MTINVGRRRMALVPVASSRKQQATTDLRAMAEELPTALTGQLCSSAQGHWCVGFESHEASLVQQLGAAAWEAAWETAQWQLGGGREPFFAGARQIALASGW